MNRKDIRQIFLDTETTGMNRSGPSYKGHNIIEIGAIEMINRKLTGRKFHTYVNPKRSVDYDAFMVHGISDDFLKDKPYFYEIADKFIDFINGSELIIHNAAFDIGFIDYELSKTKINISSIKNITTITDSLLLARKIFPGKRNNLDKLCDRYHIDKSKRKLHGALLDAELLGEVYIAMTSNQMSLELDNSFNKRDIFF